MPFGEKGTNLRLALSGSLSPVPFERKGLQNCDHFSRFSERGRVISLQPRLSGGVSETRAHVRVSTKVPETIIGFVTQRSCGTLLVRKSPKRLANTGPMGLTDSQPIGLFDPGICKQTPADNWHTRASPESSPSGSRRSSCVSHKPVSVQPPDVDGSVATRAFVGTDRTGQ